MATSASLLLGIVCFLEQSIWALCGLSPQPSIRAVPGAVISTGSSVTIFCRIPPGVSLVRLTHYGDNGRFYDHTPLDSQEVAEFHLQNMMHSNAGTYYCAYYKQGDWSVSKGRVELVVTGVYRKKPSLVHSGLQMGSGGKVTLQCHTDDLYGIFILCGDGNASFTQNCSHQDDSTFLISPVSPGEERTYRCFGSYKDKPYLWSLPSDPLVLSITGSSPQPSIWAVPGAVISTGSSVTIFCRIPPGVSLVRLSHYDDNGRFYAYTLLGSQELAEFHLQNMTHSNAGIYYCEHLKQGKWSVRKDKAELAVTGVFRNKPSLVHSGLQMGSGGNVTLQCHIHNFYQIFILCGDGNASFPQNCSHQDDSTFLVSPASPGEERTYRCFGSYKDMPHLWSLPSDPLVLSITESSTSDYRTENCVRLGLAVLLLLVLGAVLLDAWKS